MNERTFRRLVIRAFNINEVALSEKTSINKGKLCINIAPFDAILKAEPLIKSVTLNILKPGQLDVQTNTIMDIVPISVKVLGGLGSGITHTLCGAYVLLTGADEDGRQMYEFGSSEGLLRENIFLGRRGTPALTDYIIHIDMIVEGGLPYERRLPMAVFQACDEFIETVRTVLKELEHKEASEVHEYLDKSRPDGKKVVLIKQVAGQGAMYDTYLFPKEPSGAHGGVSIIDVKNMPTVLSPNEYRDGALRCMT